MKLWQGLLLVVLLISLPLLSACEFLGFGVSREQQQAYEEQLKAYREYQEQLKAYREQQEAYQRELIEAYNEQLKKVYGEYEKGIETWHEERQEQLEQIGAE